MNRMLRDFDVPERFKWFQYHVSTNGEVGNYMEARPGLLTRIWHRLFRGLRYEEIIRYHVITDDGSPLPSIFKNIKRTEKNLWDS